jgi:polyisoprenoid-binding protein YceI
MKVKFAGLTLAILAASTALVGADTTATPVPTKSSWGGNQLMGGTASVPKTERPATTLGPVVSVTAKKGASLLALKTGSVLYLLGDSTLHKYEMGAKSLQGSAVLKASAASLSTDAGIVAALTAGKAQAMALTVPVTFLKSTESGLDDNAYKALNTTQYSEINFVLESETLAAGSTADTYVMTAKGTLTIAGVTQPIVLTADTTVKDGVIRIKGVQKLKMTDYKVTPPVFNLLVTSIKCTDEIEIHYDVLFALATDAAAN